MRALAAASVFGQHSPSRPVKIVVPTSPGGATDALSRQIGARPLRGSGASPVIVGTNRARTRIHRREYVAKSAPDRQHPSCRMHRLVITRHSTGTMAYDGLRRFIADHRARALPLGGRIPPSVARRTFQELVATPAPTRARSPTLLRPELLCALSVDSSRKLLGIDIVHVPTRAPGPPVTDLLGGQIHMMMVTPLLVEPHGARRQAAPPRRRHSRAHRPPARPAHGERVGSRGLRGPAPGSPRGAAGMPREVSHALYADVKKVLNEPASRKNTSTGSVRIVANTPEEVRRVSRDRIRALGESRQSSRG